MKSNTRSSYLELVFQPTEAFQFDTELECGEYWIAAGQRYQRRTRKCAVGVDTRAGVLQTVVCRASNTLVTAAAGVVRPRHPVTAVQQHFDDLVVVPMCGHDDRRHVRRERATRHRRRLAVLAEEPLNTGPCCQLVDFITS